MPELVLGGGAEVGEEGARAAVCREGVEGEAVTGREGECDLQKSLLMSNVCKRQEWWRGGRG